MRYIGQDMVWQNLVPYVSQELKQGQSYNVRISSDSPRIVVNGRSIIPDNASILVNFDNGVSIPYAPDFFHNFWEEINSECT